jgi:hypothetical protein
MIVAIHARPLTRQRLAVALFCLLALAASASALRLIISGERRRGVEQGLGSSTWWDEAEYRQLRTVNDRALFILDKLIKRDITKFQAAWAVAFPGRRMNALQPVQPDEVTRGPWLVILTRMGATREETTDILDRVGRRW